MEARGGKDAASIILEMVRVLAIAQETYTEEGKAKVVKTVTLELSPKDATKLALVVRQGSIHLALRSPLEQPTREEPVMAGQTEEAPPPAPVQRAVSRARPRAAKPSGAASKLIKVEEIRGTTKQIVNVPE